MAANKAQKQTQPERAFMRGPHSSESAEQTVAQTKNEIDDVEKPKRKWYQIGFPTSVYFIITNEFCERFTYYGMKAILTLYLLNGLKYDSATTVVIYHAFAMLCYFTPIFGGMIADVWWGKYLTIVILSIVYAIGNCTTAFTSFDDIAVDIKRIGCFTGLVLIGIGTGGIKPCVSSFGADQIPEEQTEVRSRFFASFYFAINAGSMLSMIITPILRSEVECGGGPCFPLAFGVPAGLMIVAIAIFLIGTPLYVRAKPKGNVLVEVFKCIARAIKNWRKFRKTSPKPNLLDYADDKFTPQFIADVRACKRIIVMMLPVPVFWALFDQTGSTWTLQGQKMDGTLGSIYILPDQFQVINPVLVMIMIPLFQAFIYPAFNKCNLFLPNRLLQRMVAGGILAALAFVVAAVVQKIIEPSAFKEAKHGYGWIHVINADDHCNISVTYNGDNIELPPFNWAEISMDRTHDKLPYVSANCENISGTVVNITVPERTVRTIVFNGNNNLQIDNPNPFEDSTGSARVLWYNSPGMYEEDVKHIEVFEGPADADKISSWKFYNATKEFQMLDNGGEFWQISTGAHKFDAEVTYADGKTAIKEVGSFQKGIDSSTVIVLKYNSTGDKFEMYTVQELPAKEFSMFLMIPQYVVITSAEILFSVSGLDFAYSQAPISMRSVMMAVWLLTVAFGNLIVLILAEISLFGPAGMSLFYAALMAVDILVFAIMAYFYVYIDQVEDTKKGGSPSNSSHAGSISGTPPPGYPNDGYDHEKYTPDYSNGAPGQFNKSHADVDEETNL